MIDTVIFDIGNVLVDFDRIAYLTDLFHDEETVDRVDYLLIKKYNLNPETCIYIDDKQTNVDVATSLGMKGMVYNIE